MMKFFKKNLYKIIIIIFVLVLPIFSSAQTAKDSIVVETTGYSVLSANSFVFGGDYSGNIDKKPFTTYFEFKKNDANLDNGTDREETIKIVRPTKLKPEVDEYSDFYTSPELDLFSTYYFRAVGFFNDTPDQKFYGNILKIDTGYIPPGYLNNGVIIPFTIDGINFSKPKTYFPTKAASGILASVYVDTITEDSAIFKAIIFNKDAQSLNLKLEYGEEGDFTTQSGILSIDSTGYTSFTLTGLKANTTYQYRLVNASELFDVTDTLLFTTRPTAVATPEPTPSAPEVNTGLVPCDNSAEHPCGFKELGDLINTIVDFILFKISLPIAAIMFAYAGFELVTSGGSTEKKSKATSIFTNVAIGLIVVAAAWLIVQAILSIVGYTGPTFFGK